MSESTHCFPPGGHAGAEPSAGTGGRLLAFLGWPALLGGITLFALVSFVRLEHRAEADRRYALADEQRSAAEEAATLAKDLAAGTALVAAGVSTLRTRSLAILVRLPPEPEARLRTEWARIAGGIDTLEAEWTRILEFQSGLEALQGAGRTLREGSDRLANALSGSEGAAPLGWAKALSLVSRRFAEEVARAGLSEPAHLDRARELLDIHASVRSLPPTGTTRHPSGTASSAGTTPPPHTEFAAFDDGLDAARKRLAEVRRMAGALEPASTALRNLTASSARVMEFLSDFEARIRRQPAFLGASLDGWFLCCAILAFAGLLALSWRRFRLFRSEVAGLDRAWGEAAASDWRARGLVRDLLRTIDSLDRRPADGRERMDGEDLEGSVREAKASLPRIVARRSQSTAAILAARELLEERLCAARDSVLVQLGPDPGELDTTPLEEIETTFREATLFAMAALARDIRAAVSGDARTGEATGSPAHAANGTDALHGIVSRGFDLLERSLECVLAGREEERVAIIFFLDDLRAVQEKTPFSSFLDFDPALAYPRETGGPEADTNGSAVLRADAARMLPSFRKGLAEWADGDGASAAMLMRGSVSVLAHAAEGGKPPARSFWNVASAFCTALCERAIPAGPAVRRIMGEIASEFDATAQGEETPEPPARLLRELLIYIALAKSDHEELQEVRTAFELDRYPLAIPERPGDADPSEEGGEGGIPSEIIQQLEGIRAVLDRIDGPGETLSRRRAAP